MSGGRIRVSVWFFVLTSLWRPLWPHLVESWLCRLPPCPLNAVSSWSDEVQRGCSGYCMGSLHASPLGIAKVRHFLTHTGFKLAAHSVVVKVMFNLLDCPRLSPALGSGAARHRVCQSHFLLRGGRGGASAEWLQLPANLQSPFHGERDR